MRKRKPARDLDRARDRLESAARSLSSKKTAIGHLDDSARALEEAADLMQRAADSREIHASEAIVARSARAQATDALERIERIHEDLQETYTSSGAVPSPQKVREILQQGAQEAVRKVESAIDILQAGGRGTQEKWASRALGNPVSVAVAVTAAVVAAATALIETRTFLIAAVCMATGAQIIIMGRAVTVSHRLDDRAIDLHAAAAAALIPVMGGALIAAGGHFRTAVFLSVAMFLWLAFQWLAARWKILG